MAEQFCVLVFAYEVRVFFVRTESEKIPEAGEEVEIDFSKPDTIFIEGVWGDDAEMSGIFSFTVQKHSQAIEESNGLPVAEHQLACEDLWSPVWLQGFCLLEVF